MKKLFENWKRYMKEEEQASSSKVMDEVSFNTMSAKSVFEDEGEINEFKQQDYTYEVHTQQEPNPNVVERFAKSLYAGKRSGFLSYYSSEELAKMDLYLIEGENAGFAIKDGDDIVSVHNNSSLKGLGKVFIDKAISVGGSKLDHFDGFLSGLYRRFGFTDVYEVYQWDEQYKPQGWDFDAVDIFNPKTSIYAEGIEDKFNLGREVTVKAEDNFEVDLVPVDKVNQYRHGRPDVIMRKLK